MEPIYWIWLQEALGTASASADAAWERSLSPRELLHSSQKALESLGCFTSSQIYKMKNLSLNHAERIAELCQKEGLWILTPDMAEYPERLLNIYQMPLVLYGRGNPKLLSEELLLTMVGSREPTVCGEYAAEDIGFDLTQYGFGVVSGLAVGIDSYSHRGVLNAGGMAIGVAGCGLDIDYPAANHDLREEIKNKGVIISEYAPGTPLRRQHFPARNRILSGLSLGTVVVEASSHSGALITTELALQQGRDVFVLPTDIYNEKGMGNLMLIRQGATLVTCARDIAEEYFIQYGDKMTPKAEYSQLELRRQQYGKKSSQKKHETLETVKENVPLPKPQPAPQKRAENKLQEQENTLNDRQKSVLNCLGEKPRCIEEIVQQSGIPIWELLAILSELEINGLIEAFPGKQFGRRSSIRK